MTVAVSVCVLLVGMKMLAQAPLSSVAPNHEAGVVGTIPVYDIATIKPNKSGRGGVDIDQNLNMFSANNVSVRLLLSNAFGLREELVSGLPGWAESAHYDVVAKAVDGDPNTMRHLTDEQRRKMLQRLLADRFQLKTHIEVKQLPVFDLVIARGGIKFAEFQRGKPNQEEGSMSVRDTEMNAYGVPIQTLTAVLESIVERNVLDKTGLNGEYDLQLKWSKGDGSDAGLRDEAEPPIFTALQEQLGLKLESSKGPVDTLVVDHIQAPSEN